MTEQIVLYGASGFSGRLIAREACRRFDGTGVELLLAGRDGEELKKLAGKLRAGPHGVRVGTRIVEVDDGARLDACLGAPGVTTLVNAAGPFADTAEPLLKAALRNRRHYVDINGEADVYRRLDDYAYLADQCGVTVVSGAGHSATASDLMLAAALKALHETRCAEIGTARIAYSHVRYLSRGSARTAWRSMREQTRVVQRRVGRDGKPELALCYEPNGRLERVFDFGQSAKAKADGDERPARRIATAVNLLDLMTARLTLDNSGLRVRRIETYMELPPGTRELVQVGAMTAPLQAFPVWRRLVQAKLDLLPVGPTRAERLKDWHTVLLEIDDGAGRTLIDWRLETPHPYDFTATCAVAIADRLRQKQPTGWRTPSELFRSDKRYGEAGSRLLSVCRLDRRIG